MRLKISNLRYHEPKTADDFYNVVPQLKGFKMMVPDRVALLKESIDARGRNVAYCYTILVDCNAEINLERVKSANRGLHIGVVDEDEAADLAVTPLFGARPPRSVLIVGTGPAGYFAARLLAQAGFRVTVIDRGRPVEERLRDVRRLFGEAALEPESNICFGEGGAGTFSDGKLTTRKNHPYIRYIFDVLVEMGAPPEILTAGKPHIGSDRLRAVMIFFRKDLADRGCDIRFGQRLDGLRLREGRVAGVAINGEERDDFEAVVLATGHSARDTFRLLRSAGVPMQPKPFAIGTRVEHPQELINRIQYGAAAADMPAADYKLVHNIDELRATYSFCMCPGGEIVCAASHPGFHVVNGMSNYRRNNAFANAALVVKVNPEDFHREMGGRLGEPGADPLVGVAFQEKFERLAFEMAGGSYRAPATRMTDFLAGRPTSRAIGATSYTAGVVEGAVHECLPPFVVESIRTSLREFGRWMPGYVTEEAVFLGVETRTSSPVRIPRTPDGHSPAARNLYPCGEGAGYAGGIVSAALDGINVALNIIRQERAASEAAERLAKSP